MALLPLAALVYDNDGSGDGEAVYFSTRPLTPEGGAPAPVGCAAGLTDCGGVCVDLVNDRIHHGACAAARVELINCSGGNCGGSGGRLPT